METFTVPAPVWVEEYDELAEMVSNDLLTRFEGNGIVPITMSEDMANRVLDIGLPAALGCALNSLNEFLPDGCAFNGSYIDCSCGECSPTMMRIDFGELWEMHYLMTAACDALEAAGITWNNKTNTWEGEL